MMDKDRKLVITYDNHGHKYTVELPWDSDGAQVVTAFAGIMHQAGFHKDSIGQLIQSEGLPVWEWDVRA